MKLCDFSVGFWGFGQPVLLLLFFFNVYKTVFGVRRAAACLAPSLRSPGLGYPARIGAF